MKHVFLIHSHTICLTALGVIDRLKLKVEDVVFVYWRHYKNSLNLPYRHYDMSKEIEASYHIILSWSRKHFLINKKNRDTVVGLYDKFIETEVGERYYLYSPQLSQVYIQIFATNPNCEEVFFIQEGGRAMYSFLEQPNMPVFDWYNRLFLRNEKRFWKQTGWFPAKTARYRKPIVAYAFDKEYFGDKPSKTIMVKWPSFPLDLDIDTSRPIFTLEGAVELGQIERSVYVKAVEKLIDTCAKDRNYIKFHPMQSAEIKAVYLDMFRQRGLEVEELPMDTPFELIVSSFKNLTVCGFGTSLLFFAKAFGHTYISQEENLMSSRLYRRYCKNLAKL